MEEGEKVMESKQKVLGMPEESIVILIENEMSLQIMEESSGITMAEI